MTMGDELPVTSLVLPVLIRPVLTQPSIVGMEKVEISLEVSSHIMQHGPVASDYRVWYLCLLRSLLEFLEKYDLGASQTLRAALTKAEAAIPGLNYDLVAGIMRRADIPVNMNESLLRLQGTLTENECADLRLNRSEEAFQELNKKSAALKKILSRIPDEITDRKTFLETIKEIASAIKKLLDAVNEVSTYTPGPGKQALEQRKREFVKYSKRFSNTLKEYFKEGQANAVFVSALYLIHQTNQILYTVKNKSEFIKSDFVTALTRVTGPGLRFVSSCTADNGWSWLSASPLLPPAGLPPAPSLPVTLDTGTRAPRPHIFTRTSFFLYARLQSGGVIDFGSDASFLADGADAAPWLQMKASDTLPYADRCVDEKFDDIATASNAMRNKILMEHLLWCRRGWRLAGGGARAGICWVSWECRTDNNNTGDDECCLLTAYLMLPIPVTVPSARGEQYVNEHVRTRKHMWPRAGAHRLLSGHD
ncbi:Programmed cell death protein 10 [Papilio machaon]|uniref:Programmed cell death protein 10 n=1 Tax=Papilio machaon TaxID=76193 RepID=A0A194RBE6_PAPMA|nr:Programmed cell death protein 10 [Papilio machaon]